MRPLGIDGDYSMDSSANAAGYFGSALKSYGLTGTFAGRASGAGAEQLGTYSGSTLADQVKYMLQVSENNIAEMLFRNVAVAKGYVPNWTNSSRAATEVLGSLGIPLSSVSLTSGSGVSRNDRLTPVALTTILQRVADATTYPELAPVYWGKECRSPESQEHSPQVRDGSPRTPPNVRAACCVPRPELCSTPSDSQGSRWVRTGD